jgi:CRP/FNR family transcriptional activator FtrB
MAKDAQFAVAVARDLAGCYRGLVRSIKNQKLRGGAERLANYLLTLRAGQQAERRVRLPHEKRILASLLGMTPENLSRAFAALQKQGVSVNGSEVVLADVRELERLAKPDPLIDNYAPRGGGIMAESDAEIWSSEHNPFDIKR